MHSILIVDDSVSMRQMVGYTLKSSGFDVTAAEDGDIALNIARDNPTGFDLVITDVNMPNMDGISLVRELRQLPQFQYKPILVLTTESSTEKKMQGKAAGATGWIVKPFNPDQLIATVARVLDRT
ncbi:MAG: response regulator [Pseudomonadales bacterium]|nr:response regulator [Pseudomonadales bacterium]MCP5185273.1 response regulator [Pseudomonadales bacterium]